MSKPPGPSPETTRRIGEHCLCLHAQRAARALARRFDEAFRPLGLTSGQFSLLMSLNRPEPPTIGSVAQHLCMDRTTLTAALKPLARRTLVDVTEDASDRRVKRLKLTDQGRDILSRAVGTWRSEHDALDALLASATGAGPDGLRDISDMLKREGPGLTPPG